MGTSYSDAREEEERANAARETMAMEYEDFRGKFKRTMSNEREEMTRKVAESEAQLQQQADYLEKMYLDQLAEEKGEMEKKMDVLQTEFKVECKRMAGERAELMVQTNMARTECERLAAEKMQMFHNMTEFRDLCERTMEEGRAEMTRKQEAMEQELARSREEMAKKLADEKAAAERASAEMARKMEAEKAASAASSREMERKMQEEKASAEQRLAGFRAQTEAQLRAMEEEKTMAAAATAEMARKMEEEKFHAEHRLAEFREQKEAQLRMERQVTTDIMQCLRELPPLQTAMEFGDIRMLEEELQKWGADALPERFGDCKGVVEAVLKLARERLVIWRGVHNTVQEVLKEAERTGGNVSSYGDRCLRLFRAIKEAQLTKLDVVRSDPGIMEKICTVFYTWQEHAMSFPNSVQRSIVHKVVTFKQLGAFQFVDLDICLRLVDRSEDGNQIFLSRARTIVEDEKTTPKDLKPLLAHIETMLFFLKYAKSEDLSLTHTEFRKQMTSNSLTPAVAQHLKWALSAYPAGSELARLSEGRSLMDGKDVSDVLAEIRAPARGSKDDLGFFREIFYHWALAMRSKFDLLVLPHHTQVVCLLAFRHFLEEAQQQKQKPTASSPSTLVAQVGTGEGKSMIIAILAIYVVVVLRKKVHVVVDDESLLERDFWTFKPLFDAFEVPSELNGNVVRPISAKLCVTEERLASEKNPCLAPRVDPEADVCYCEGKHVQSFYASIAKDDKCDFDGYADRILIVDEVDALVIDEEPNEAFVYPNQELSKMATMVASALKKGTRPEDAIKSSTHPAAPRLIREMSVEWAVGMNLVVGEDFVYAKEVGKNCVLRGGRANPNEWSLALECRNFQDGHIKEIVFQERLFVMSRPRVFRKYFRLLGVTGSIGSDAERKFLKETYRASFFEVPPFLKTCRGSPFHAAMPATLGARKQAVYVEASPEAQLHRLAEVALEAREKVPVLVIARDRSQADKFVERLRLAARSRGLGNASEDAVRCLSRTLYEADPEQWKENLNRATLPLGDSVGGSSWRITVTDPRGGRGTDYRVDDSDVDGRGGLLLIPTIVPESQREWVQFLGRTARQDRKGQFCAVLCTEDYELLSKKYRKILTGGNDLTAIDTVLSWGDRECTERIQGSAALYNCGVRMNELCEEIFGKSHKLLEDINVRETLVTTCQSYRYLSVRDIDNAFAQIPGFVPANVPTEACDVGPALERQLPLGSGRFASTGRQLPLNSTRRSLGAYPMPPGSAGSIAAMPGGTVSLGMQPSAAPKMVVFCLDYSTSMLSRDTGTPLNRFETCIQCMQRIIRDQINDRDMVGIVGFGADVKTVVFPTVKGTGQAKITQELQRLAPSMYGGTCFFDAVSACVQSMGLSAVAPLQWPRWLVCLTDGDDVGSKRENARGQDVTKALNSGMMKNLNMVVITVGRLKEENMQVIDTWVEKVQSFGGIGKHVCEKDAASIVMAFDVVAEYLAADVGGAVVC